MCPVMLYISYSRSHWHGYYSHYNYYQLVCNKTYNYFFSKHISPKNIMIKKRHPITMKSMFVIL